MRVLDDAGNAVVGQPVRHGVMPHRKALGVDGTCGGHEQATQDCGDQRRADAMHSLDEHHAAVLPKKADGQKRLMAYLGHLLMDNRHGLIVNACAPAATGTTECEAAEIMLPRGRWRGTLGADKNYDVASSVFAVRAAGLTPHVAQKVKYTAIDARTARHSG